MAAAASAAARRHNNRAATISRAATRQTLSSRRTSGWANGRSATHRHPAPKTATSQSSREERPARYGRHQRLAEADSNRRGVEFLRRTTAVARFESQRRGWSSTFATLAMGTQRAGRGRDGMSSGPQSSARRRQDTTRWPRRAEPREKRSEPGRAIRMARFCCCQVATTDSGPRMRTRTAPTFVPTRAIVLTKFAAP